MDNVLEEENPDWNRFEDYITSPDEPHKFGECEEDWYDFEWKKGQQKIDRRKKEEEWEIWIKQLESYSDPFFL